MLRPARNNHRVSLLACVLLVVLVRLPIGEAAADYIVLKNGKRLNGLVRAETALWVRIETVGGLLTLDRSDINHVEKQPTGENLMLSGSLALRKPDFLQAADLLMRSLDAGGDAAQIRKAIIEGSPQFLDRLAYVSKTEKKQWLALCDELARRGGVDADWAYWRGEMARAMGDDGAALEAWQSLHADYFAGHPDNRTHVTKWVLQRLSRAVAERQFDESVATVELLNELDPERARSCQIVLTMQRAAAARDSGDITGACRIYAEELMSLSPEIAKVCLRTAIEPRCDLLCERGAFDEAIALVRQCASPHLPELTSRLLAKAYRGAIRSHLAGKRWEKASDLLTEASELFDEAERERIRQDCLYGERRARLAPGDYGSHYQLGLELQEKKMNKAAVEEFILASQSPQLREMAEKQIAMIREGEALVLMEEIVGRYGEGEYLEVLDLVDEFRQKAPRSDMADRVNQIAKLAHQKAREEAEKAVVRASSKVEHARRLDYRGKTDEALELLDGVLRDQPTVPAAIKARALKQEILRRRLAEGVGAGRERPAVQRATASAANSLLPDIDPALLDQLDEDAFKAEIERILKQLEL